MSGYTLSKKAEEDIIDLFVDGAKKFGLDADGAFTTSFLKTPTPRFFLIAVMPVQEQNMLY